MLLFRVPIRKFIKAVKEPAVIAFSTTSSEAALPRAMEAMERLGVPRSVVAFVLPLGYSFNLDGSTLYLSLAAVFVAQAANVQLTIGQQITMLLTLMLTSKGVAGVPRASLVILAATLASYGLPLEGVTLILGVDTLMDMGRTMTNVIGNCLASVVVARWEGVFKEASDASSSWRRSAAKSERMAIRSDGPAQRRFKLWFFEGLRETGVTIAAHHQSPWWKVMCLTGRRLLLHARLSARHRLSRRRPALAGRDARPRAADAVRRAADLQPRRRGQPARPGQHLDARGAAAAVEGQGRRAVPARLCRDRLRDHDHAVGGRRHRAHHRQPVRAGRRSTIRSR